MPPYNIGDRRGKEFSKSRVGKLTSFGRISNSNDLLRKDGGRGKDIGESALDLRMANTRRSYEKLRNAREAHHTWSHQDDDQAIGS